VHLALRVKVIVGEAVQQVGRITLLAAAAGRVRLDLMLMVQHQETAALGLHLLSTGQLPHIRGVVALAGLLKALLAAQVA